MRLISPDRPGIGRSERQPGRTLLDWPADVAALADELEVSRFAVMGWSAGGAYAAACAFALPERVSAVALIASVIPATGRGWRSGQPDGPCLHGSFTSTCRSSTTSSSARWALAARFSPNALSAAVSAVARRRLPRRRTRCSRRRVLRTDLRGHAQPRRRRGRLPRPRFAVGLRPRRDLAGRTHVAGYC